MSTLIHNGTDFVEIKEDENKGDTEIIITNVIGGVKHNSDYTWLTCAAGKDVTVEFSLATGEARTFIMTLTGKGTTPDAKFFAVVDNLGQGKVVLNFDNAGEYSYTNIEANLGLPEPLFFTKDLRVEVGKLTGDIQSNLN